jgi:uncharacterized protein YidB (DUF937 family)
MLTINSMGLFDTLAKQALGGFFGGKQADMLGGLLHEAGGLAGLKHRFDSAGLQATFSSWVGTGENQPIQAPQIQEILGKDALQGLADRLGVNMGMLLPLMAQFLPQIIDQLTPNGQVEAAHPTPEQLQDVLGNVMKSGLSGLFGSRA